MKLVEFLCISGIENLFMFELGWLLFPCSYFFVEKNLDRHNFSAEHNLKFFSSSKFFCSRVSFFFVYFHAKSATKNYNRTGLVDISLQPQLEKLPKKFPSVSRKTGFKLLIFVLSRANQASEQAYKLNR